MNRVVLLALLGLAACHSARAQPEQAQERQQHFQRGNQAYLDGDYSTAVEEYRKVLESGPLHADLAYNLANAYFRLGKKGLAVLFYEKALRFRPGDRAASSNLAIVRQALVDRVVMQSGSEAGEPPWQTFVRGFSLDTVTLVFLAVYFLVFTLAIVRRLTPRTSLKRQLFWLNLPLITLLVLVGIFFATSWYLNEKVRHGVMIAPVAELREGPDSAARVQMEVHEGLKVRLLSESAGYARVRLANGVEGYLRSDQMGEI